MQLTANQTDAQSTVCAASLKAPSHPHKLYIILHAAPVGGGYSQSSTVLLGLQVLSVVAY